VPKRWCIDCQELFDMDATGTRRCPGCQPAATRRRQARPSSSSRGLGWDFSRRKGADAGYQAATHCQCPACPRHTGVCGEAFTKSNPKTGGHTIPRSQGGHTSRLLAVCRSCNSSDGGTLARRK
jgi:5-methylcytosine-specific restriction endonuclease McrA